MKLFCLLVLNIPSVPLLSHSFRQCDGYGCTRFFVKYVLFKVFVLLIKTRILRG